MDRLNQLSTCDGILKELNGKLNPEHTYLYTEFFTQKFGYGPAQRALQQLKKDGYINEGHDVNKDPDKHPNHSYTISPSGQFFIENQSYEIKYANDLEKEKYSLAISKSVIKTNNNSRILGRIAVSIALASAIASVGTYFKKDGKDELYKQLLQTQHKLDSTQGVLFHVRNLSVISKNEVKKDSLKK